ncbi:MFGE8 [Lepeophtheirus salmonis]|uniref:MFGE8 n=1 Tax=Lepeophtheirus salmonis TaxID=72036 RepID=A0A7R8CUU5_LEPSM|nr:MFGE8 [Lepeophtheirus salmonis]CAF2939467.1 MFGE8 [Lepeophtheirus salmonis]
MNDVLQHLFVFVIFAALKILPVDSEEGSSSPSSFSFTSTGCSHPLGLTSGAIQDWQIAASSVIPRSVDSHCAVKNARLHSGRNRAWCPMSGSKTRMAPCRLGMGYAIFMVSYSLDAYTWDFARDMCGEKKVFKGNSDSHTLKNSYLEHPVEARFVRIHIVDWHRHPSLRLEIIGCQKCNEIISTLPFTEITASSFKPWKRRKSCIPELGDLNTKKGWCPRKQNEKQWLQFDLGPPKLITGLVTKGLGDRKRYVISYRFSYSNDSFVWYFYQDVKSDKPKTFGGNMDKNTERRHYLNTPVVARYVRFHPVEWHKKIGMRAGVIGCPHTGECGPGFMQVNSGSPCIPNKAYQRKTWSNIEKYSNDNYKYGHSSLAVDGLGQDEITAYADYVFKLDSLSVYISHKKDLDYYELGPASSKCGTISREKNAIFSPKLHFDCSEPAKGRYLYVKASGKPDRWRKLFTVILCEIMVY